MKRANLVVLAGAVSMIGWGSVLPYQYAYAANTRGWGTMVAAAAASLFSIGALLAAPVGGRLADRFPPVRIAVAAKAIAAAATVGLLLSGSPLPFLAAMFVFGVGVTAAQPAQSVLILRWVGSQDRRRVFAWQFTGLALGMAIGALVSSQFVNLDHEHGMAPSFLMAATGFVLSGALIAWAGHGASDAAGMEVEPASGAMPMGFLPSLRVVAAVPALRWVGLVTVLIALGFYAQFESGLPAFALMFLNLPVPTIGLAAAVNCLVIVALQMVVVRWTAHRDPASLLVGVGLIWLVCWGVLAASVHTPGIAAVLFVTTFGIFAVGETLFAPILNPLTASLAPAGMVGTTLGLLASLQTGVSAAGPLLAGLALGAGHGSVFLGVHLGISVLAVLSAMRLRVVLRRSSQPARPAVDAWNEPGHGAVTATGPTTPAPLAGM